MILRIGYDIEFEFPNPVAVVALLHVHPTRVVDLRAPDHLTTAPAIAVEPYIDSFGNLCTRVDLRCPPQLSPHRSRVDGDGPRCFRRSPHNFIWRSQPAPLQCRDRRSDGSYPGGVRNHKRLMLFPEIFYQWTLVPAIWWTTIYRTSYISRRPNKSGGRRCGR